MPNAVVDQIPEEELDLDLDVSDWYVDESPIDLSTLPSDRGFTLEQRAIVQTVDTGAMTADFVIVTRGQNANMHGNKVQIVPSKLGAGLLTEFHEVAPVVLLEHGFAGVPFPIAMSRNGGIRDGTYSVKKRARQSTATATFSQVLPEAELVFALIDEGILTMSSIGFRIMKAMKLEQKAQPKLPDGVEDWERWFRGHDFVESMLFEWSVVSQGADPGAVRAMLERQSLNDVRVPGSMLPMLQGIASNDRILWPGASISEVQAVATNCVGGVCAVDDFTIANAVEQQSSGCGCQTPKTVELELTADGDPITVTFPKGTSDADVDRLHKGFQRVADDVESFGMTTVPEITVDLPEFFNRTREQLDEVRDAVALFVRDFAREPESDTGVDTNSGSRNPRLDVDSVLQAIDDRYGIDERSSIPLVNVDRLEKELSERLGLDRFEKGTRLIRERLERASGKPT